MLAPILSFFFAQNSHSIFEHNARTEHNFEHIAMILRVTLKSMMLKFPSIIYLTLPGSEGYFREPGFDQNTVRDLGKSKLYLDGKWDLTATRQAGFIKTWARDAGFFACLLGIQKSY